MPRRMSRAIAIKECKELWAEIKESGLCKYSFIHSGAGDKWREKNYIGHCPLCEYAEYGKEYSEDCHRCPLVIQYGENCSQLGFAGFHKSTTDAWFAAVEGLK